MPLSGERVELRELRESDYPFLAALRNDLDTQAWSRVLPPDYTVGMFHNRYDNRPYEFNRDSATFAVESGGTIVGFCVYSGLIDRHEATTGIAIAKECWGTGVGHEAHDLLLRLLFHEMGVVVVRLWTQTGNTQAMASFEKLGFRIAVRQRRAVFMRGEHFDNIQMDLLREEWYTRHRSLVDGLDDPFSPVASGVHD